MIQFRNIRESTSDNCHCDALDYGIASLILSEETRDDKRGELTSIRKEQNRVGYMTPDLLERRRVVRDFVFDEAKKQFDEVTLALFKVCF